MIVHVITNLHPSSGGPTAAVVELAREQAGTGEPVRVIVDEAPADPAAITDRWFGRDVRILSAGNAPGSRQVRPELARTLRELQPRIVHLHGAWDRIVRLSSSACREVGLPWAISSHGMLHPAALAIGAVKKWAYLTAFPGIIGGTRSVLCINAEEASAVRRRWGVRSIVAPTGIDPARYALVPDGSFAHSVPGLEQSRFALFLGRLDRIKGVDLLLHSFAVAASSGCPLHLVLAGPDQGAGASLRSLAGRLGLSAVTHFVGPLSGVRKLHALVECEVFAHRPRYEGFGIALVEAMAAGRPVVTTAACRLDGAAEAGAIRVVPDHTCTFAKAMVDLADDRMEARALGARGQEWVRREMAWPSILAKVEHGYRA